MRIKEMIEVENLVKRYGTVEAVKGVSFSVGKDQVLGLLGPNGAGKTTIMKILTGYHFPSAGSALVDGISAEEDPVGVKKLIGYLPENVPLYADLTVDEYLSFMAGARLIPKAERKKAIDGSIKACGLGQVRFKKIETLSKGYRQRTGLAQAILHDPAILILDEPTAGLDPNQIIEIRSLIKELGRRKTVILSTHILQEVEAVCSHVLILNEGHIAAQGKPEEIAGAIKGGDTWELFIKGCPSGELGLKLAGLKKSLGTDITVTSSEEAGENKIALSLLIPGESENAGEYLFDWAVTERLKLLSMNRRRLSLEDIFVKLTSEQLTRGQVNKGGEK
jgi:ABC-2 type transport system ATP-binding protein